MREDNDVAGREFRHRRRCAGPSVVRAAIDQCAPDAFELDRPLEFENMICGGDRRDCLAARNARFDPAFGYWIIPFAGIDQGRGSFAGSMRPPAWWPSSLPAEAFRCRHVRQTAGSSRCSNAGSRDPWRGRALVLLLLTRRELGSPLASRQIEEVQRVSRFRQAQLLLLGNADARAAGRLDPAA